MSVALDRIEIRIAGFGGQGIIRAGIILGKALAIYDNKNATLIQSFGPEARGGACNVQLIISDKKINYPYIVSPDILVIMSQEAFTRFSDELKRDGTLIYEKDLVKLAKKVNADKIFSIPATRLAEEIGHRIIANIVMLGYLTKVTKVVSEEAMRKSIPTLVPEKLIEINMKAFDAGFNYE